MITSQPIDLGKVSEQTKETGNGGGDSVAHPFTEPSA